MYFQILNHSIPFFMKTKLRYAALILTGALMMGTGLQAQKKNKEEAPKGYDFTREIDLPATPVKNQYRTGTCWS